MTSALADEYFRLAHNDTTGKPLLHARAISLGLAAALLGELIYAKKIIIRDGNLHLLDRTPPDNALAHATLDQIKAQSQHALVRTWLGFLSTTAYEDVAERLWRAGHVRPVSGRRLLRQTVTYVPTDLLTASAPWVRLTAILGRGEATCWSDGFLLCLSSVTGLDSHLLRDLPPSAGDHLKRLWASAPASIGELTAVTASAVGDSVLSYRS